MNEERIAGPFQSGSDEASAWWNEILLYFRDIPRYSVIGWNRAGKNVRL